MPVTLPSRIADWPDDAREAYEERAAIMEYGAAPDAGLTRETAECCAAGRVRAEWARRPTALTPRHGSA